MATVKLYPPFERVYQEVLIDPQSLFWLYHQEVDPNGDPLDILSRAEEGDEVACMITTFEFHRSIKGF